MKKLFLSILFLVSVATSGLSQTATGVFTQTPCNSDGIYTVSTTGLALPITYTYYLDNSTIVHANVNSATDQLTNIEMTSWGYVSCQATSGAQSAWAQGSYTPSFNFNISAIDPVCPATMGTLSATQNGGTTGPFSFDWTNTTTLNTYSGNNASVPLGDYSAIITDLTTGCALHIADTFLNVQQTSNVTATINTTQAACTNGTATAVASGGVAPYSYQWVTGATTSTISNLTQGSYPLTVTDAQGCTSNYLSAYIQQNPYISVNTTITNATCVQSDGSVMAFGSGGTGPYTYAWSDGQTVQNATNLSGPAAYTVIATDANGCIGQGYAYVNVSTPITVTYSATPSQCTSATGSATITATGGTGPYTFNWNTSPAASGQTLSNVPPGSYSFTVTDAVGCVRTGSAVVPPVSTISASAGAAGVLCPNTTGSATVSASGSNPPFTYLWSNGATTNQITGVPLGGYTCVITDALGCDVTKTANISSVSPINLSVATVPATCIFNADGSATPIVSGGSAPYSYSYTNGTTATTATNLGVGNYWLTVTDGNGCSKSKYFQIGNANTSSDCYCTISGNVYVDANSDCIYDATESGVENIMIHCSGYGYTFTDASGHYSFQVPSGTYTITEQVNAYYPLSACQTNGTSVSVVAATGCNTTVDFSNNLVTIHDLRITTVNSFAPPVPGNNYQQKVIVTNDGTVTESGVQLGYMHDGQLPFSTSSSASFLQLNPIGAPYNYSIQSGFPSLSPASSDVMLLNYATPTNIPLGTVVDFFDTVAHAAPIATTWLSDYTPWNNVKTYQPIVVSSYDPNYKEVSPAGEGAAGNIGSDVTEFDYTIHFQNEGTYFAQNIYITDQLDADLDWTTLKPGYSDYNYTTTVSETGLVTFTFAGINLPWKSGYGNALSSGLINYSIQRKSGLAQGTEFTNTADIFFDFNAPITTNTTLNTLFDANASIDNTIDIAKDGITIDLFPVPAQDYLNIRVNNMTNSETATLSIIDLMGNVVLSDYIALSPGTTAVKQNTSSLATGTYLTRIQFSNGSFIVKKIVVNQK